MSINIARENMKMVKTVVSESNVVNFDWDIIVPDSKPDIGTVLKVDAISAITNKEIMQDRAVINGNVKMNILYIPQDEPGLVKHIETVQSFTNVMELSGLRQNMDLNLYAEVDRVEAHVLNSRKVNLNLGILLNGNVSDENSMEFLSGIEGGGIEYLTRDIVTYKTVSDSEDIIVIKEEIEVPMGKPSIHEILKLDLRLNNLDVRPLSDKLVVKGDLAAVSIYNGEIDEDMLQYMEHEIPFTEILSVNGIGENSVCDTDYFIKDINYYSKENIDGEYRVIAIEACVVIKTKAYENVRMSAVVDAYAKDREIHIEKSKFVYDEVIGNLSNQLVVKGVCDYGDIPEIKKVYSINATASINTVTAENGKVKVDGVVKSDILYQADGDGASICAAAGELPFSSTADCEGACESVICEAKVDITQLGYNIMSGNQLELRAALDIKERIKNIAECELIQNISVDEDSAVTAERPSIVIYFCRDNEDLWDIAKEYRTTVADIMGANELSPEDDIKAGMKLLIP